MGESCAIDLRVAGSNPAGQLLIYFHNVFSVLTKTLSAFKSSSQIPHQSFRAQTGLNPAGQLLIYFHNVFQFLQKLCRHSSLVPRSRIKAFVGKPRLAHAGLRPPCSRLQWSRLWGQHGCIKFISMYVRSTTVTYTSGLLLKSFKLHKTNFAVRRS